MILTPTEQRVVDLIVGELLSYQAAAARLGWHKETVRGYVRSIAQRLPGTAPAQRKVIAHFSRDFT